MPRMSALAVSCALLLATGTGAWAIRNQGSFRIIQNRLGDLPRTLLGYEGTDDRFEDSVYAVLANDYNLLRRYLDPTGRVIWLYIGYYGTSKGGRPAHIPQYCYTGQGFAIEEWSLVPAPGGRPSERINRMVVKRGHERQLILFWFHSDGDRMLGSGLDQNLLRLRNRLLGERDDGSLVRLSMSIPMGQDRLVSDKLSAFAVELRRLLPQNWPVEARHR